jgi:hypothetical protein
MRHLFVLLLQTCFYVPYQLRSPIVGMGDGLGNGYLPSKAYIQHVRLQVEFQSCSMEREGTRSHCCGILGFCKRPLRIQVHLLLTSIVLHSLWSWSIVCNGTLLRKKDKRWVGHPFPYYDPDDWLRIRGPLQRHPRPTPFVILSWCSSQCGIVQRYA